ncbi:hypothetical protein [Paenibacillus sp. IHBB 10380]|uniref:hypothetical protein n=1 Tax=Paenibacillus sp. IHBB 10380 TaxID=1566358 RepID=UPI000B2593EA|nr:hypothetical protein [Paenibacillus sp. IHBB 10380]
MNDNHYHIALQCSIHKYGLSAFRHRLFLNFLGIVSHCQQMGDGCAENRCAGDGGLQHVTHWVAACCDAMNMLHFRNILILLIYGFGLGMITTPLVNVVLSVVPMKDAGTGSGLFTTFMYLANSLGVALISILFSVSLGQSLIEAHLSDYVRAFSVSLMASGGLAFATFVCLCFLREPKKFKKIHKSNLEVLYEDII